MLPRLADPGVGLVYTNAHILGHPTGHHIYIFDPDAHPIDRFPKLAEQNPVPALRTTMRTHAVRADRKLASFRWPEPTRGRTYDRRRHELYELRMWTAFALRHPMTPGPRRQVRVRLGREVERLRFRR
jgi:hypothetical protein